jgi:hypothetical protein
LRIDAGFQHIHAGSGLAGVRARARGILSVQTIGSSYKNTSASSWNQGFAVVPSEVHFVAAADNGGANAELDDGGAHGDE